MKTIVALLVCFLSFEIQALEYEQQFENDQICVAKAKIFPHEEIGEHRDVYPQIVVALKGGTITRFEADGKIRNLEFPTGVAVVTAADPENELHRSANNSSDPIELLIIQLKDNNIPPKRKIENSHEVAIDIRINCPMSKELKEFAASIPADGNYSSSRDEWKSSFISNMTQLIKLVESDKVFDSSWSVKTDVASN